MNAKHLKWTIPDPIKATLLEILSETTFPTEKASNWISKINSNSFTQDQRHQITKLFKCIHLITKFNLENSNEAQITSKQQNLQKLQSQIIRPEVDEVSLDENFCINLVNLIYSKRDGWIC